MELFFPCLKSLSSASPGSPIFFISLAPCPMPDAPCPMPHAPCPMPYAPCPMPHAPCPKSIAATSVVQIVLVDLLNQ
ncbi:hypothetical protein [Nostoc linckia]|uniref:hypothetical protein n=1 Tax=Nostoc linckia TaxID=92942 RepID=UPI0015D4C3CE|nr:hypothetical protein [Nostoc linckia]